MINRILIRIKAVQMLYSYLLTQSDFNLASYDPAEARTADTRYANRLAIAMLGLVLEMSGLAEHPGMPRLAPNKVLQRSRLAVSLRENATLRGLMARAGIDPAVFDDVLVELREKVVSSALYRSFARSSADPLGAEVKFWKETLRLVVATDPGFQKAARQIEGYTKAGFERGLIAAVEIVDSYALSNRQLSDARDNLQRSLDKAYELYHGLLWLPVEITRAQALRLDLARHKYLPTDQDLNPNLRFIDNTFVAELEENKALEDYRKDHPYDWPGEAHLVDKLLDEVLASEAYQAYMSAPGRSTPQADAELWRELFKSVILPSGALAQALEEQSVFWNDDLDIMGTFVLKTIRRYSTTLREETEAHIRPPFEPLPQYKDEEDAEFGAKLFDIAVDNRDYFRSLIDKFTRDRRWDSDRLAFMDIVVMITALAEITGFPAIPLAVSFNEYIEIAKSYSTGRSGDFVNGILNSIVNYLKDNGELVK